MRVEKIRGAVAVWLPFKKLLIMTIEDLYNGLRFDCNNKRDSYIIQELSNDREKCLLCHNKGYNSPSYPTYLIVQEINAGRWTIIENYYQIY